MCLWTLLLVDWLEIVASLDNAMTFHLYATSSKVFSCVPSGLLPYKNLLKLRRGFLFCVFSRFKWKMNGVQKSGAPFPDKNNVFSSQDWSGRSWHGEWELTFHTGKLVIQATFVYSMCTWERGQAGNTTIPNSGYLILQSIGLL